MTQRGYSRVLTKICMVTFARISLWEMMRRVVRCGEESRGGQEARLGFGARERFAGGREGGVGERREETVYV